MSTHRLRYIATTSLLLVAPLATFAATNKTLSDLIGSAIGYLNEALALLMGFGVVAFVFFVVRYFIVANDKRAEGAQYIMWATIAFFVIFSMWGLVNILISTFNIGTGSPGSWTSLSSLFPQ